MINKLTHVPLSAGQRMTVEDEEILEQEIDELLSENLDNIRFMFLAVGNHSMATQTEYSLGENAVSMAQLAFSKARMKEAAFGYSTNRNATKIIEKEQNTLIPRVSQ
jgi:hypothetical protein